MYLNQHFTKINQELLSLRAGISFTLLDFVRLIFRVLEPSFFLSAIIQRILLQEILDIPLVLVRF